MSGASCFRGTSHWMQEYPKPNLLQGQSGANFKLCFNFNKIWCTHLYLWKSAEHHQNWEVFCPGIFLACKVSGINQIKIGKALPRQQPQMTPSGWSFPPQHGTGLWGGLGLLITLCRLCFLDLMELMYSPQNHIYACIWFGAQL